MLWRWLGVQKRLFYSSPSSDTIFALASAPGRAGVSVVRVSGPQVHLVVEGMVGARLQLPLAPRQMTRCRLLDEKGQTMDESMFAYFKGPASFTGEDVAEFHVHGSTAVVAAVHRRLAAFPGCRMALPGEFSLRAFHHGKMNLAQVEALADLIAAETEEQRRLAIWGMGGEPARILAAWRQSIITEAARIEAWIDFGEDENIEADVIQTSRLNLAALRTRIVAQIAKDQDSELIKQGFKMVLTGRPNAGKSSLLNGLLGRKAAIVSPLPGTTRDIIQAGLSLSGFPLVVYDTAGLRPSTLDQIESEGMSMALDAIRSADLVLFLVDPESRATLADDLQALDPSKTVVVCSKADLDCAPVELPEAFAHCPVWHTSSLDRGLFAGFKEDLTRLVVARLSSISQDMPVLSQQRHRQCLERAARHIGRCLETDDMVVGAEALRAAIREIGLVTGEVDPEEILDSLFSSFCIGK